jgi:hypothetical protein
MRNDRTHLRRPVPADFAEVVAAIGWLGARKHYGCGGTTIARWFDELTPPQRSTVLIGTRKRQSQHAMDMLKKRHLKAVAEGRAKPKDEAQKAPKRKPFFNARIPGTDYVPTPCGGVLSRAMTHLQQRGFRPVFDAGKVYGKALTGVYVAGRLKLDADGLLALAAQKGFDPDAWRQVTA